MNNVWFAIVAFFKKLFVPPEYTTFERELLRQISHLESELFQQRERYEERYSELLERFLPGNNRPESAPSESPVALNSKPSWDERKKFHEEQSKLRAEELKARKLTQEYWTKHIADLEKKSENETKAKSYSPPAVEVQNDEGDYDADGNTAR
jgi:hypothetical protein